MSDSVRPHRPQPTRLPRPWDSPGKITAVGCHFLLQCMKVKSESEVAQSCLILREPMDYTVHGILQARTLEWVAFPSNGTPLQYSCLENPMDGGAWWAAVHGVTKSRTRQRLHFHFSVSCIGEGNGNPLQCSYLENPRDGGAWWAAIYGVMLELRIQR